MGLYREMTLFTTGEEGWTCMAYTMTTEKETLAVKILNEPPEIGDFGTPEVAAWTPGKKRKYAVVHQHDRTGIGFEALVPAVKARVERDCKSGVCSEGPG
jgi:hypothetical protein